MADGRKEVLGEVWFPVGEVSVESVRERSAPTALPPVYYLHVWFARRPLATSRAAIIAGLTPKNWSKQKFFSFLGFPDKVNVIKAYQDYLRAKAEKRKIVNPYTWKRSFSHNINLKDIVDFHKDIGFNGKNNLKILDPFAGGGSIPLEVIRLGLNIDAIDINPVSFACLKCTLEYPVKFGSDLIKDVTNFCNSIHESSKAELNDLFPGSNEEKIFSYLWTRTIKCPHCGLNVPLSPNWWILNTENRKIGAKINTSIDSENCVISIVNIDKVKDFNPDEGSISGGDAICPRCKSTIEGEFIKSEAQNGKMGHQPYCVCLKVKKGNHEDWDFRTPNNDEILANEKSREIISKKFTDLVNNGFLPNEEIPEGQKTQEPLNYGIKKWADLFNDRQKITHSTYLKYYLIEKEKLFENIKYKENREYIEAILLYSAFVFDCCIDYNSSLSIWHPSRYVIAHTMALQAFPFKYSYAEWNQIVDGGGFQWALSKTLKAYREILDLIGENPGKANISLGNAQSLKIDSNSVDFVITDPPYSNNVMYAEISDFFYVWQKRTIGDLFSDYYSDELTNKTDEAVANSARFKGMKKAKNLAEQDYAAKMEASFREIHRVLTEDGVLCVMFTHRKAEAWESLAESLMNAGFVLRSSWPVHTEPGDKFGKANKGALKVTVLLYCRKRYLRHPGRWEDVVEEIRDIAYQKIKEYQDYGIKGPDLLVSLYGPALGKFSEYYPVKDITGKIIRAGEALTIVAQVVNEFLTGDIKGADMEALSYLNLLRNAPGLTIEYDLARLTTVFGGNTSVDALDVKGGSGLVKKSGGKVKILIAKNRQELGVLNPDRAEKFKGLMDVVHAAILIYERQGIESVTRLLQETGRDTHDAGIISVLSAIGAIGEDASSDLVAEARMANALLEALGHSPAGVGKSGERITHYM